jgi:nitrite reductase (NO-forming)
MNNFTKFLFTGLLVALLITACGGGQSAKPAEVAGANGQVEYHLKSGLLDGKMVFLGVGGSIDGQTNPTLKAKAGDVVTITMESGEGAEHDISFPDFNATSEKVSGQGNTVTLTFTVDKGGSFAYFCTVPGHREAGMEGKIETEGPAATAVNYTSSAQPGATEAMVISPADPSAVDVARDPTDLPAPIGDRAPETVTVNLETVEVVGKLADGTTYKYWTFGGQVPGPFIRVRVGDTVIVNFSNNASSVMTHSVDFHAVTGPGGGAVFTQMSPGMSTSFSFKALNPGLYVYHCATPMVPDHIANGMYGLILVEPEGGLPPVDREFYVMQGELYTSEPFGTQGNLHDDTTKLLSENPEYFVLNGQVGALTTLHPLKANVGETVRIFFGVGGPNFTSSFHVIGEIFDRVYDQASLTSPPLLNVQTTLVPPGGATMVEFQLQVPGRYILVDHALSRLMRGLAGYLLVEGPAAPEIFSGTPMPGSGH